MKPWVRIAFWAIVAAQLVFLLGFIAVREVSLRTGTEIILQTVPVDPRSLLQGDYAILDYEVARMPSRLPDWDVGSTVYVELREGSPHWRAGSYSRSLSDMRTQVFLKGRVDRPGHLDFGIGTYFLPERTGRIIEGADDVKVVVSVDIDGNAVIKEALVDGEPFDPDVRE
ncbi:MAG: GDYXXLXY domain-containing protein [Chloroflexota bacterium]|nr:GDYXXLXY domain-containing protein [Chloroflexota bacterium]